MIVLNKNNAADVIRVTPYENSSAVFTYYYIKFVNRITQNVVELFALNTSTTLRYQKLSCNSLTKFVGEDSGFWDYEIHGSNAQSVIDEDILEIGFMYLEDTIIAPVKYDEQSNNFVTYNG